MFISFVLLSQIPTFSGKNQSFLIISDVIKEQKSPLIAVCVLAFSYIIISALVVFNVEPNTFGNFFDAIYWATVSLTTVGYG
ncbi:MAG: two pore domain potassium channel family protein, partial [Spirochaetales bacterium]|nr:two pore domain potassium channel family protein [Spirochaetales bacterium]